MNEIKLRKLIRREILKEFTATGGGRAAYKARKTAAATVGAKKASKGVKAAQKFVNKQKYPDPITGKSFVWKNFGEPVPTPLIDMLKAEIASNGKSLYTNMSVIDSFDINNIGEIYYTNYKKC